MKQPKVKDVHGVLYLNDRIRIGTVQDLAFEILDPDKKYSSFIRLLDGGNTVESIVQQLSDVLTEQEIFEGLQLLCEEGVIEDAAILPPDEFSVDELMRYKVNLNFFSTLTKGKESKYDYQLKLKQTHVLILGMGGIGSNICMALAELGIGKLTAVDFDKVELSNLNRQVLYSTNAVGRLKTEVAAERIRDFNPEIEFRTVNKRICALEDVKELIAEDNYDLVINVADRPTGLIDFWVNEVCCEQRVPYFAAVVAKHYGRIYSVFPGETACYHCMFTEESERSSNIKNEVEVIRESGFWTPNGALGPTCMFHAYFLSYEVMRYLLSLGPVLTKNKIYEINFVTFESEFHPFDKREDCRVCSEKVGVHQ